MKKKSDNIQTKTNTYPDKCPVCGKSMPYNRLVCNTCGYDLSLDHQSFPTLERVGSNADTVNKLKIAYEKKIEEEKKRKKEQKEYDNAKKRIIELEEENTKLKNDGIKVENTSKNRQKELREAKKRIDELEKEKEEIVAKYNELINQNEKNKYILDEKNELEKKYNEVIRDTGKQKSKIILLKEENERLQSTQTDKDQDNIELKRDYNELL